MADTKLSSSAPTSTARLVLGDEVPHPRLVAVLAGRRVAARPRPAVVRQAVRARLARPRRPPAGTGGPARSRRRCPIDVVERTRGEVRGGLRADHRTSLHLTQISATLGSTHDLDATGGAGYIGAHIVRAFQRARRSGRRTRRPVERHPRERALRRALSWEASVADQQAVAEAIREHGVPASCTSRRRKRSVSRSRSRCSTGLRTSAACARCSSPASTRASTGCCSRPVPRFWRAAPSSRSPRRALTCTDQPHGETKLAGEWMLRGPGHARPGCARPPCATSTSPAPARPSWLTAASQPGDPDLRGGRRPARTRSCSATTTPLVTGPASATTSTWSTWPMPTPWPQTPGRGRPRRGLQRRTRRGHRRQGGPRDRPRGDRRGLHHETSSAGGAGDAPSYFADASKIREQRGWQARPGPARHGPVPGPPSGPAALTRAAQRPRATPHPLLLPPPPSALRVVPR